MPWIRDPDNPIIRPEPGTWKHHRCTSCTLAFKDVQCFFYHDGGIGFWWDGVPGFNWIGLLTCPEDRFDGKTFEPFLCNPVLTHGRFCDIDRLGMISPRVRIIDDMFHLYYNATSYESFTPGRPPVWRKTIGLATSPDGINFEKVGGEGVVRLRPGYGAGTPTPFLHEGRWHMLTCQAPIDRSRGYGVYVTVSDNPRGFDRQLECVFGPGAESAWDGHSVVAPAFCLDEESGWYYMLYGGMDRQFDYPAAYGLARSRDLRTWERHPRNPLIRRGDPGAWDDGAIWFTEFAEINRRFYAWYEGRSAGRDRGEEYSPGATKQIGLMALEGDPWAIAR